MKNSSRLAGVAAIALMASSDALANCVVRDSSNAPIEGFGDALGILLESLEECPSDVIELRREIEAKGAEIASFMVANRGFHNPARGSFSVFESVSGEFFGSTVMDHEFLFGHFVGPSGDRLVLQQSGGLMVEAIAWDQAKELYNFYELIGFPDGTRAWFYRGDSSDILADVANLYLAAEGEPHFGSRLRCSSCHVDGGPIMKELSTPHGDWWTEALGVPLGGRSPEGELASIMTQLSDASVLAETVEAGIDALADSSSWEEEKARQTGKQRLRPLFCATEINLEPALAGTSAERLSLPVSFFVNPFWVKEESPVEVELAGYDAALVEKGSRFPETDRPDAQYPFLTPVPSYGDRRQVNAMLETGVIDEDFIADVLAVDMRSPLFSGERCGLLRHVPDDLKDGWQEDFAAALQAADTPASRTLAANLEDPERDLAFHRSSAETFLAACREAAQDSDWVGALVDLLAQRRREVFASAISSNPGRQILEPGFRIIFPVWPGQPEPGTFRLSEDCRVVLSQG